MSHSTHFYKRRREDNIRGWHVWMYIIVAFVPHCTQGWILCIVLSYWSERTCTCVKIPVIFMFIRPCTSLYVPVTCAPASEVISSINKSWSHPAASSVCVWVLSLMQRITNRDSSVYISPIWDCVGDGPGWFPGKLREAAACCLIEVGKQIFVRRMVSHHPFSLVELKHTVKMVLMKH